MKKLLIGSLLGIGCLSAPAFADAYLGRNNHGHNVYVAQNGSNNTALSWIEYASGIRKYVWVQADCRNRSVREAGPVETFSWNQRMGRFYKTGSIHRDSSWKNASSSEHWQEYRYICGR